MMMSNDSSNRHAAREDDVTTLTANSPWSPATLTSACETLTFDTTGMLRLIRIEGALPTRPGAARDVTLLAKAIAETFDLGTWLAYHDGIITVTFERRRTGESRGR